jgi:hypothetical protein
MTAYNFTLADPISPWAAGISYQVIATFSLTAALAINDTITATGIIPASGVEVTDLVIAHNELDTNATPVGTYAVGDDLSTNSYIATAPLGNSTDTTFLDGVEQITSRSLIGSVYYTDLNPHNIIMTITATPATAATTGLIKLIVNYRCVGTPL